MSDAEDISNKIRQAHLEMLVTHAQTAMSRTKASIRGKPERDEARRYLAETISWLRELQRSLALEVEVES